MPRDGKVVLCFFFFFQAEDGIRDYKVTGVQTCALPILSLAQPGEGFVLEATSGAATPARSAEFSVRLTLVQLSAGAEYTCGVTVVAFAYCWGANVAGQLGDGATDQRVIPTPRSEERRVGKECRSRWS